MVCETNRFSWRLMGWALASAVLTIVIALLRRSGVIPASLQWIAALLPVLPMIGFFLGMGRWLRSIDELQRLIHLEALLFQFCATAIVVMGYGALAKVDAVPRISVEDALNYVWIAAFLLWGVGLVMVRRKYL
jgi:hypothetical protein